jgi:predicted RNA-binding protein Jag
MNGETSEEKIGEHSKAVLIGKEGETLLTLEEARNYFKEKKAAYNPESEKGSEEFRELANGF